jgi:SH3 domain protein
MKRYLNKLLPLIILLATPLQAAYITDKLVAGLYETAEVSDKPLKALSSGTPLEVVSRENGFIKVRTPDGTIGYVEATYLTDEKPARSMLLELQAKNAQLQKQLELARSEAGLAPADADAPDQAAAAGMQDELLKLRSQLDEQTTSVAALEQQNTQLQAANQALQQQQRQIAAIVGVQVADSAQLSSSASPAQALASSDWPWLMHALAAVGLVLGFLAGLLLMRYRIRRRFGTVLRV